MMSIWFPRDTRTGLSQGSWIHLRAVLLHYYISTFLITCEHVNTLHHKYSLDQLYIVTVNPRQLYYIHVTAISVVKIVSLPCIGSFDQCPITEASH